VEAAGFDFSPAISLASPIRLLSLLPTSVFSFVPDAATYSSNTGRGTNS